MDDLTNDSVPSRQRRRGLRGSLAALVLRIGGWRAEGAAPDAARCVIVAAPHTYWWDWFWMLMFAWYYGLSINWMVKNTSTKGPLGRLLLRTGAIPVDRRAPHVLVGELVRAFAEREELHLSWTVGSTG
jgi:1-acyl-sn-glycerol-3-phosphate acyltransferase